MARNKMSHRTKCHLSRTSTYFSVKISGCKGWKFSNLTKIKLRYWFKHTLNERQNHKVWPWPWPWFIPHPTGHIWLHSDAIRVCQELPPLLPPSWAPSFVGLGWLRSSSSLLVDLVRSCILVPASIVLAVVYAGGPYGKHAQAIEVVFLSVCCPWSRKIKKSRKILNRKIMKYKQNRFNGYHSLCLFFCASGINEKTCNIKHKSYLTHERGNCRRDVISAFLYFIARI